MKNLKKFIALAFAVVLMNTTTIWAGLNSTEPAGEKMSFLDNEKLRSEKLLKLRIATYKWLQKTVTVPNGGP